MNAIRSIVFSCFLLLWSMADAWAQCATCKGQLEGEESRDMAAAVNSGILYLLAMPFLLVGIVGGIWYFKRKEQLKRQELQGMASLDSPVSADKLFGENPPSLN